jgi:dihydroorotate dehydrogenase
MEHNILERILDGTMEPTDLPLETLREITDNFSRNRIIGVGGFATVYKVIYTILLLARIRYFLKT